MLKWDRNFYDLKVGGRQVYDWMHQQGTLNDGTELDYAWGLSIGEHRGLRTVKHGGALGGYRTALVRYPDQKFSVVILANLSTIKPSDLASQVAEIYLEEVEVEQVVFPLPGIINGIPRLKYTINIG